MAPIDISPTIQKHKASRELWSGNTEEVFAVGHAVRDGLYDDPSIVATDTGEVFDLVVVGAGFSGVAAAYFFSQAKEGKAKVLVLENHWMVGGNAQRDEFKVKEKVLYAPQGSIVAQDLPAAFAPASPQVQTIFQKLKIDFEAIRVPPESSVFGVFCQEGTNTAPPRWYSNLFEVPLTEETRKDLAAFLESAGHFYDGPSWKANLNTLDHYTFKDYAGKTQGWCAELFHQLVPDLASFFGFPDAVSAAAVFAQYGGQAPRALYAFPGGNSGFLRHLVKALIPEAIRGGNSTREIINGLVNLAALDRPENPVRVRLGATAVRVEHEGRPDEAAHVRVLFSRKGKLYRLRARSVIMAGGGYITRHIVRDMPTENQEAYGKFIYVPVLWINVALNNSRALDKAGVNFLSTYHGGFGVILAAYEKMSRTGGEPPRDPQRPNVIGIGAPRFRLGLSPQEQAIRGRVEMLETPFRDYEREIRRELVRLLGPWGFDPKKDIEAIAISRWGHHGYIFPYPGFLTSDLLNAAKKPCGRIAFAHTDLEGFSHMMGAIAQGHRASHEILERI